jgi:lysophospholipase L1-like esterase
LKASHFLDGIHLNATGQHILSRALAEDLLDELSSAT